MPLVTPHPEPPPPPSGATQHCRQYALILGLQAPYSPCVYGTEDMNDHEVLRYLRDHSDGLAPETRWKLTHSDLKGGAFIGGVVVWRVDDCIICRLPSPCPYVLDNGGNRNATG